MKTLYERCFGASRKTLRRRLNRSDQESRQQAARAKAAEKEVRALRVALDDQERKFQRKFSEERRARVDAETARDVEPGAVDGCVKVRLHTAHEALAWAATIAVRTNVDVRIYKTYRCDICPVHPLTGKYYHVAHRTPGWKRVAQAVKESQVGLAETLAASAEVDD